MRFTNCKKCRCNNGDVGCIRAVVFEVVVVMSIFVSDSCSIKSSVFGYVVVPTWFQVRSIPYLRSDRHALGLKARALLVISSRSRLWMVMFVGSSVHTFFPSENRRRFGIERVRRTEQRNLHDVLENRLRRTQLVERRIRGDPARRNCPDSPEASR